MQLWPGHYSGPPPTSQGYPQAPTYPTPNSQSGPSYSSYPPGQPYARPGDPRGVDPGYYPHPRWLNSRKSHVKSSVLFWKSTPVHSHILIVFWLFFPLLAPSREAPCGRMCHHLLHLHFVDYGMTLWRVEPGVDLTGRADLWMKIISGKLWDPKSFFFCFVQLKNLNIQYWQEKNSIMYY